MLQLFAMGVLEACGGLLLPARKMLARKETAAHLQHCSAQGLRAAAAASAAAATSAQGWTLTRWDARWTG